MYGVHNVGNVLILEYMTKKPVLYLPEVTFSGIDLENEFKHESGGHQGMSLIGWNAAPDAKFTIQTPVLSMKFLELAAAGDIESNTSLLHEVEVLDLDSNHAAKLSFEPSQSNPIYVFAVDTSGRQILQEITVYSLSTDNGKHYITLSNPVASGLIMIFYYTTDTADVLNLGPEVNKGYYTLIGETGIYNEQTANEEQLKFQFPKVQIIQSFNLKMLNAKSPNQMFAIICHALKDEKEKVLFKLMKRVEG